MFRRVSLAVLLTIAAAFCVPQVRPAFAAPITVAYAEIPMFTTEQAAQAHCPRDIVVWLNTHTGIWHEKGMRWYGHTKEGAMSAAKRPLPQAIAIRGMGNKA